MVTHVWELFLTISQYLFPWDTDFTRCSLISTLKHHKGVLIVFQLAEFLFFSLSKFNHRYVPKNKFNKDYTLMIRAAKHSYLFFYSSYWIYELPSANPVMMILSSWRGMVQKVTWMATVRIIQRKSLTFALSCGGGSGCVSLVEFINKGAGKFIMELFDFVNPEKKI